MADDNPSKKSFERTVREATERGTAATEQATKRAEQSYFSAAEGITEFNIKLLNIAQINAKAGMTFATELMHANGPKEAFEVWSRHAQSHFQRLADQSQELASLGQKIASSSTQPLTRGYDQVFKRAS